MKKFLAAFLFALFGFATSATAYTPNDIVTYYPDGPGGSSTGAAIGDSGISVLNIGSGVASIAALRLNTVASNYITVAGYYGQGTLGGGVFSYVSSDTSSADNGGTIIVDVAGHRYYRLFANPATPEMFGAKADGVTDDTATVQDAISAGTHVSLSAHTYCIKTGPLLTGPAGFTLQGAGDLASNLSACGADVSILNLGGMVGANQAAQAYKDFGVEGSQNILTTHPAILGECGQCLFSNLRVTGGSNTFRINGNNNLVEQVFAFDAYGTDANFYTDGPGFGWFEGDTFDTAYPLNANPTATGSASTCANSCTFSGYSTSQPYYQGNMAEVTFGGRSFYIMKVNSGNATPGGASIPVPQPYGVTFPDPNNSAITWQLVGTVGQDTVRVDGLGGTGGAQMFFSGCDFTGYAFIGLHFTNYASQITLSNSVFGGNVGGAITLDTGSNNIALANNYIVGGYTTNSLGIQESSSYGGNLTVSGNTFLNAMQQAISFGAGTSGNIATGNIVNSNIQEGIVIGSGVQVTATGNDLSGAASSPILGASTAAVGSFIEANKGYNPVGVTSATYTPLTGVTYQGGPTSETHYLSGGTVTAVKVPNASGTTICSSTPCTVVLGPNDTFSVTYSGAPTDTKAVH